MSGALFLLALFAVAFLGAAMLPGRLAWSERLPIGAALAGVLLTIEMVLASWGGVRWVPGLLLAPLALGLLRRERRSGERAAPGGGLSRALPGLAAALAGLLLLGYAAWSARMTSADLLLFWGTKGEHFALARGLDMDFFRIPPRGRMHPDYPPLLPCLYAWGTMWAGRLPWRTALLLAPIFLGLGAALFGSFAKRRLPAREAAELAAVYTGLLGLGLFASRSAGNAEPALLFYETLALCALVFAPESRAAPWLAGLGLAGAALTKVEGALFAVLAILAVLWLVRPMRRWRAALALAVPPAAAVALWALFAARAGALQFYTPAAAARFDPRYAPEVARGLLRAASYGTLYLPWLALAALGIAKRPAPSARLPLAIGAAYLVTMFAIYLKDGVDPTSWIAASAPRTLLAPMLCLLFAVAAPTDEAVPLSDSRPSP